MLLKLKKTLHIPEIKENAVIVVLPARVERAIYP